MEPWELTFDAFLGDSMVGDCFGIDGRDEEHDIIWEAAESLAPPSWRGPDGYAVCRIEDFEPPDTFLLLDPDANPCGFYSDSQLWIDEKHRGRGLSVHLVLASARFNGGRPILYTGVIGFSQAGYAAHAAAHRHSVAEALRHGLPVPVEVREEFEKHLNGLNSRNM